MRGFRLVVLVNWVNFWVYFGFIELEIEEGFSVFEF